MFTYWKLYPKMLELEGMTFKRGTTLVNGWMALLQELSSF
jgi:hypothetical protein